MLYAIYNIYIYIYIYIYIHTHTHTHTHRCLFLSARSRWGVNPCRSTSPTATMTWRCAHACLPQGRHRGGGLVLHVVHMLLIGPAHSAHILLIRFLCTNAMLT